MGKVILGNLLSSRWSEYDPDTSIYISKGSAIGLDTFVTLLPFDSSATLVGRLFEGQVYWLGIEQVRDAIEGLEQQLGRQATPEERLRAVDHYARFDAFIDPVQAVKQL